MVEMVELVYTANDLRRFLNKFNINNDTGCWEWNAGKSWGYGVFWLKSLDSCIGAHIFSVIAFHMPLEKGQCVCHHCDNPSCVNPDHLFIGTHLDNMRDRDAKGRDSFSKPPGFNKGIKHSLYGTRMTESSKIKMSATKHKCDYTEAMTLAKADAIRAEWLELRKLKIKVLDAEESLAAKYNTTPSTVGNIVYGVSWKR